VAQLPFTFRQGQNRLLETAEPAAPEKRPSDERPVVYSVSQLQRKLRTELEDRYQTILVSGEISNFTINARSGHGYFTLKDENAQIKCVMWRDQLMRVRHRLDDGLQVIVRARVTIYEQGGQLQLSVQQIEPRGLGARQLEFNERVERLRAEGLTADSRKRRVPRFPETIGLVTSSSSAALRDVLRTILRRDPFAQVIIVHAQVQGEGAEHAIVRALRVLDNLERCDVILLCRGGGSTEDLWCFNEECVARAIVQTRVPVVTGIGHETDTTIADLVADLRASTPTAAAEHVVPVRSEVRAQWRKLEDALHKSLLNRVQASSRKLYALSTRLRDPQAALRSRAQRIDELTLRMDRSLRERIKRRQNALDGLERRVVRLDPVIGVRKTEHRIGLLASRAENAVHKQLDRDQHRLAVVVHKLESLSPLAVLSRGYALVTGPDGHVLRSSAGVRARDELSVRLSEGSLDVEVIRTKP
jgi:exodeoxyribonuclease VII large subunit